MKKTYFLLWAVFLLCAGSSAQVTNNNPGNYAEVNGTKLYYEIHGEGKPLLLLHGNGGSIKDYGAFISEFAKNYKVIAVDNRCHGKSECKTNELDFEMMASDVNELLNRLNIDSCLVYGHSDGGIMGLIMAFQYPKKVKRLITTGANIQCDSSALFPQLITLAKMYPMIPDTLIKKRLKLLVSHPNIPYETLRNISVPVLIMAGDRDAVREEHTVKIYQSIPNAQLCILPGTTHFIAKEKPLLFSMLVTDFFEKPFIQPSTVDIMQKMANDMMRGGRKRN